MAKLLLNLSMLGPRPTGLGVYSMRCAQAACDAFDADVIAAGSYRGPGRVTQRSPEGVVIGAGKYTGVRRWLWSTRFVQPPATLLYSPTHHGFGAASAQILTIHDLTSVHFPATHPIQSFYFKRVLPRQLAACRAVFTVSETTKRDLHEAYGVALNTIHVVPNGVDTSVFFPVDGVPREEFLLVVGATFNHKNIGELIERSNLWKHRYRLVIVSSRGKYREQLGEMVAAKALQSRVTFVPYASLEELVHLYRTCAAFVFPSKWEGFGIPPLEALACGARVIVSDIPAHREVLGDAAHFVTLGDETSWEAAFAAIDRPDDPVVARAQEPVAKYTWARSGEALVAALLKVDATLQRSPVAELVG